MKNFFLVVLSVLFLVVAGQCDWTAVVDRVVDGDTIKVRIKEVQCPVHGSDKEGTIFTIRLLGIDTPESKENEKAKKDSKKTSVSLDEIVKRGKLAKDYLSSILTTNREVQLSFEQVRQDHYGRLLAYVWISKLKVVGGSEMVNLKMIADGYALPYMTPKDFKDQAESLYLKAKTEHRGLWK